MLLHKPRNLCNIINWQYIMALDRDQWRALLKMVINIRVPYMAENFLTSWGSISFSRRVLLHGVNEWVRQYRIFFLSQKSVSTHHEARPQRMCKHFSSCFGAICQGTLMNSNLAPLVFINFSFNTAAPYWTSIRFNFGPQCWIWTFYM
jgi:hypothetical protein